MSHVRHNLPDYTKLSDSECDEEKLKLMKRKLEALRIYRLARETMFQVNQDYDRKCEAIDKSRDKLKKHNSNHKGMD